MAGTEHTLYEVKDDAAWITLNRPENRNALSAGLITELYDHLVAANKDDRARCMVITGNGPAFCAGADLKGGSAPSGRTVSFVDLLNQMMDSKKPVIVAINGFAFAGGLGIVAAADIVVTSEDAKFSFSEVKIGVIPAMISVVCLRKLGKHHGMKLFLTGERFDGKQAVHYGLAHRAVPLADLTAAVQEEVDAIKLGGPIAVAEAKKLVRMVPELSIEEGFKITAEWSPKLFASEEGQEGMRAFREKRKPRWVTE
ncbi:MAG: enoyl-CoA hydratase/isomerase family protein [Deltaproteobacteria bacterium]|nr:enoyl-CoA hydratase/isomerase family protein [Deltaproteobacteria bacterium]